MAIKALALDVDGVLTDGSFWWNAAGEEWKRFSFIDIMGLSRAKRAGLLVTLISGENSPLVDRFAAKLGLLDYTKGCKDKAAALHAYALRNDLSLEEICFMGDDVNDLDAMALAGVAAAPSNARENVRSAAAFVSTAPGGHGAVRELVEIIIITRELEVALG